MARKKTLQLGFSDSHSTEDFERHRVLDDRSAPGPSPITQAESLLPGDGPLESASRDQLLLGERNLNEVLRVISTDSPVAIAVPTLRKIGNIECFCCVFTYVGTYAIPGAGSLTRSELMTLGEQGDSEMVRVSTADDLVPLHRDVSPGGWAEELDQEVIVRGVPGLGLELPEEPAEGVITLQPGEKDFSLGFPGAAVFRPIGGIGEGDEAEVSQLALLAIGGHEPILGTAAGLRREAGNLTTLDG